MTDEPDRPGEPSPQERGTAQDDCARWVAEFAADLRRMHEKAQKPSSRQMSMKVPYSHTALSSALRGVGGRLPSQALTLALVRACGGDEQAWRARWEREHARIAARTESRDRSAGAGAGQAMPSGPDVPPPLPRRHLRRILLPALGAALTLVIVGVVFTVTDGGSLPTTCAHTGAYISCIQQLAKQIPDNQTPQQIKDRIATFSQNPPQSPGPWPFFVYDTIVTPDEVDLGAFLPADLHQDKGVIVRTTSTSDTQQIGTVYSYSKSIVWADCYVPEGYHPQKLSKNDDVGGKWLRIHWPTNLPTTASALSSPTDPIEAYIYAGFTLPFTHNGKIPTCT
jgi:hypothetical protein